MNAFPGVRQGNSMFDRLNITAKIWLAFGVFVCGSLIAVGVSQVQGLRSETQLQTTSDALFPAAQETSEADAAFQRMAKAYQDAVLLQDAAALDRGLKDGQAVVAALKRAAALPGLNEARSMELRTLAATVATLVSEADRVYRPMIAAGASFSDEMTQRAAAMAKDTEAAKVSLQAAREGVAAVLQGELRAAVEGSTRQRWLSLFVFLGTLAAAAVVVTVTIHRSVVLPVRSVVSELTASAGQVSSASQQVAASAQSLSDGASRQAASLEETSASMEEMASMTRQNSENSQQAASLTEHAEGLIKSANVALDEMVRSMTAIKDSSDKVAKIIKTIDEIAFQTNILALNAAVEAARAGEAGMGFAVVADEVRALAQRSAQAARDTAALIEESIVRSGEGQQKVAQVTSAIASVTDNAVKVRLLIDQVSEATRQQAQGIEQVSYAIQQMETVTQTTAATAVESASASEELSAQADRSVHAVERLAALVGHGSGGSGTMAAEVSSVQSRLVMRPRAAAATPEHDFAAGSFNAPASAGTYGKF
jgi:methyl-accepting chemotaxis protein